MILVFDGLLPELHNTQILKLLFDLAHWHGLAKLQMHTNCTLKLLLWITVAFSTRICKFEEKTCWACSTHKLEHEHTARVQHWEKNPTTAEPGSSNSSPQKHNSARKLKLFSLKTYKYHSLGDYCNTIWWFGMTDSYSAQLVGPSWHCTWFG